MVARTIGKYRLAEKVGRGGMGTVYRAIDETLERDVAIKILNSEITEPEVIKRFRAEAVTLARLNHPGIAVVHELYQENGDLFMVMEFVRGQTFQQLSEHSGPMPLDQAIALGAQALDALAYAHRLGIVHRDLKPSNLMLTDTGLVKVMDFGIARIVGSEHLTGDGSMMGTPAYMSPEQVRGGEVDARADLYSMAVVLYRLLAARLPFEADTAIAFAQKQLYDPPTPLKEARPDLPPWCEGVFTRALEKSPHDRFQSAEEFKEALFESTRPSLINRQVVGSFRGDATTCTAPTPIGIPREAAAEPARLTGSRPLTGPVDPTTQRTVVISGKYFFAGTAVIALLLVALLAAVVIVARRPLGIPGADQIAAKLAPTLERTPAPAPAPPQPSPAAPSTAAPASAPVVQPSSGDAVAKGDPAAKAAAAAQNRTLPGPQASTVSKPVTTAKPPAPPASPAPSPAAANTPATATAPASGEGPAAAAAALPTLSFDNLKLLVMDGSRSREQDAKVHLADGRILIIAVGERLVASLPYDQVLTLSTSRSRQPRWRNANGTESGVDLGGGAFGFLKSDRTWLAIQTRDHTYVVRAARDDIQPLARAASERVGLPVERVAPK
jgi:eukaryotic-like serine/threonine-protein kinase